MIFVRFMSLLLTALVAGLTFCHLLELPNKLAMPAETWLAVQQHLYNMFGPVGGPMEVGALLFTLAAALLVRRRQPAAFAPTLLAFCCILAALVVWFTVVNPVNLRVNGWTAASLPGDWIAARAQWEYGHAASFALLLVALGALIFAALTAPRRGGASAAR